MNQAALFPHQKLNVSILLGLLAALPDDKYNHSEFGFNAIRTDTGCASGLAFDKRDQFDLKTVREVPDSDRSFLDRLLGRNKTTTTNCNAADYGVWDRHQFARDQFGNAVWDRVFDTIAFKGTDSEDVTKQMVMDRLAEFA